MLNGMRYLSLEGRAEDDESGWTLSLSFGRPKEPEAGVEEAELTLSSADGDLVGVFEQGRFDPVIDELTSAERERLDLSFHLDGGEGAFAGVAGRVHLYGELSGEEGALHAELDLVKAAE